MSANSDRDGQSSHLHSDDLDLTAYALGQLGEAERAEFERQLAASGGDGVRLVEQTRRLAERVRDVLASGNPSPSATLRETLIHRIGNHAAAAKPTPAAKPQSFWRRHAAELVAASLVLLLLVTVFYPAFQSARESARRAGSRDRMAVAMTATTREQDADTNRGEAHLLRYQELSGNGHDEYQARFRLGMDSDTVLTEPSEGSPRPAGREHWEEVKDGQARTKTAQPATNFRVLVSPSYA